MAKHNQQPEEQGRSFKELAKRDQHEWGPAVSERIRVVSAAFMAESRHGPQAYAEYEQSYPAWQNPVATQSYSQPEQHTSAMGRDDPDIIDPNLAYAAPQPGARVIAEQQAALSAAYQFTEASPEPEAPTDPQSMRLEEARQQIAEATNNNYDLAA